MTKSVSRTHSPTDHDRRRASLASQRGAFDLSSIVVGAVVIGILTAGVLAAVFGVLPWAQDEQAKQSLSAARTAEGTHLAKDTGFANLAGLQAAHYLPTPASRLSIDADPAGTCYMAVAKSESGKVFYSTDKFNEPKEMTLATTASPGTTVVPCLPASAVQDLVDDTGGYSPNVFTPIGDGTGTSADPGIPTKSTSASDTSVPANKDVTTGAVKVTDRTLDVALQNTSSSPTTARYAGQVTCYDPSRNSTTVENIDGYFDLNSNIYADMTLVICAPGTQPVNVEFRSFDATYTGTSGGAGSGVLYHWRAPVRYTQATWVTRGLTASYNGQWCIENQNNAATDGNPVFLAPCAKVDAQRWQWNGDGEIRQSTLDHKCAAAVNDKIVLSTCANPGQQFKARTFQGDNKTGGLIQIVDTTSGKCVDIPGGVLASVQLGLAPCNGTSTQSWYMPGLAGTLTPELLQPQIIDPEPLTPVADYNATGLTIVASAGTGWATSYWPDRTATSMTTQSYRFAFGINNAKAASNYTVEWSGAALNATGIKLPAQTLSTTFGTQGTWYGDVTAAAGGYKTGTGYVTAKITDKTTGLSSTKSWKITVSDAAIVSPTSLTGWATSYWPDRTTTEKTSGNMRFAFGINNAMSGDFTVTWSGGSKVNANAPATTSFSAQNNQGVYYGDVTAGTNGYTPGTDTLTATVRSQATGTVLTKTWTITVNQVAIVSPTSLTGWSTSYWPDRTTTEETSGSMRFAFGINNAKAGDFTVTWSGGSKVNANSPATTSFSDQNSQGVYYGDVTAGAGGYTPGTDTLTATVRHQATGYVMTKTWTITVNPVAIVAPTSLQGWSTSYWPDRTVAIGSTASPRFAFGINNAKAGDFTVTWSGGSNVNGAPTAGSYSDQNSQGVYWSSIAPGTGGFSAGTSTITATVTHVASGRTLTKTWTLTVK